MKHKLYLCSIAKLTQFLPSVFQFIHPCIRTKHSLYKNKLNYEIIWVPFFTKLRKNVREISKQSEVPVWVNNKNEVIVDSYKIKYHLK